MGVDDLQPGRLADDREVKLLPGGERLRTLLAGFLAHQSGKPDFVGKRRQDVARFLKRDKHGGHRAFGIGGSAPPDFAVAERSCKGIDRHAPDAHRIGMWRKQEAGLPGPAGREPADNIWTARQNVFHELFPRRTSGEIRRQNVRIRFRRSGPFPGRRRD